MTDPFFNKMIQSLINEIVFLNFMEKDSALDKTAIIGLQLY